MPRRHVTLRALLLLLLAVACLVGGIVCLLMLADMLGLADMVRLAVNRNARPVGQQALLGRLHTGDIVLATVLFLAAGAAGLFVITKLFRPERAPAKE